MKRFILIHLIFIICVVSQEKPSLKEKVKEFDSWLIKNIGYIEVYKRKSKHQNESFERRQDGDLYAFP